MRPWRLLVSVVACRSTAPALSCGRRGWGHRAPARIHKGREVLATYSGAVGSELFLSVQIALVVIQP